jgi:hypothetical protein
MNCREHTGVRVHPGLEHSLLQGIKLSLSQLNATLSGLVTFLGMLV